MEEEREKGREEIQEEEESEFKGLKLKRAFLVGKSSKRVYCTTPTLNSFHPHFQLQQQEDKLSCLNHINISNNNFNNNNNVSGGGGCSSSVTARQLGSNLWEILPYLNSLSKMNYNRHHKQLLAGGFSKRHAHNDNDNKGFEVQKVVVDPPDDHSDEQAVSTGSFHRQIAASIMRHHRAVDRNGPALQPVSPASYGSSMEVTPYNPAATPSSSVEYKGRMGDPSYGLKTSTELLKVLNRIWCLEEQHASNISATKALKTELDNSRMRIKDLLREKQKDSKVIGDLMNQVAAQKVVRKNMEQERLQSTLQSLRQELEDERKLRKRSESLHRKMAREISEMKSSFSKALNELDTERRARILLEDLCDEFAMGIRDYERELRSLKYRSDKDQAPKEHADSLILHISEAWLDERVQMKLAEEMRRDVGEKNMAVDKLRPEIETFLKARQTLDNTENFELPAKSSKGIGLRRQSLESYHFNEATSAPKNAADDDGGSSTDSESNCFELNNNLGAENANGFEPKNIGNPEEIEVDETVKTGSAKRNGESQEVNNGRSLSGLQARYEKHMVRMILRNGNIRKEAVVPVETDALHKSANQEALEEEGLLERRSKRFGSRGNSNHLLDNLVRNNSSSIEGEKIHPVSSLPDDSHGHFLLAGPASPVKKWEPKIISKDPEISESSSRWAKGPKENTLKARLLEARLEGRNLQSKASRGTA